MIFFVRWNILGFPINLVIGFASLPNNDTGGALEAAFAYAFGPNPLTLIFFTIDVSRFFTIVSNASNASLIFLWVPFVKYFWNTFLDFVNFFNIISNAPVFSTHIKSSGSIIFLSNKTPTKLSASFTPPGPFLNIFRIPFNPKFVIALPPAFIDAAPAFIAPLAPNLITDPTTGIIAIKDNTASTYRSRIK